MTLEREGKNKNVFLEREQKMGRRGRRKEERRGEVRGRSELVSEKESKTVKKE